jgi:hypothetical protein
MSDLFTNPGHTPVVGVFFSVRMQAGRFRLAAVPLAKRLRIQSQGTPVVSL